MSLQYITGDTGDITAVIVPIKEWESVISKLYESESGRNDTEYLLKSMKMKKRLTEAMNRTGGKTLEEVRNALGL
jgi:PHD/YefM family antitoxin component YafN of YafNO toxin-antitoxin module